MKRSDFEIMAPVGSYESLRAAIDAGADAVYFGVGKLNMRSRSAANFTVEDLGRIVGIAKRAGVKSYLTVNTILYDEELGDAHRLIDAARCEGIDAIIAADLAAILYAHRTGVEVHISTQCNISNSEAVKFYAQWADVMVLARELNLQQVAHIARQIAEQRICGPSGEPVRIEMFAHGALCMAISGRCYLSLHENGCSANRGACLQLCRRKYTLTDKESGEALDTDGRYLLSYDPQYASPTDINKIEVLYLFGGARVSQTIFFNPAGDAVSVRPKGTLRIEQSGGVIRGTMQLRVSGTAAEVRRIVLFNPADGARIVAERIEPPQLAGGDCSVTFEAQGSISPATDGADVLRGSIGFGNSADGKASEADFTLHYKLTTK